MSMKSVILAVALSAVLSPLAQAQTPDGTLRVFGAALQPTGDYEENLFGFVTTVEAESTIALGVGYEVRFSDLIGLDLGMQVADIDFELAIAGFGSIELGSATVIPIVAGLYLHPFSGERVDLHLGPTAAYVVWGDFESDQLGESGSLDSELTFGFDLGVDVEVGENDWLVTFGAGYLKTAADDGEVEIDVDPVMIRVGFGRNF